MKYNNADEYDVFKITNSGGDDDNVTLDIIDMIKVPYHLVPYIYYTYRNTMNVVTFIRSALF